LLTASAVGAEPRFKTGVRLFQGESRLSGGAAPDVVDWDNDGLNDIVVGHYSGALFVYLNRGFGRKGPVFEKGTVARQDGFGKGGMPIWAWRFNKANCVCPGPGRISPRVVDWDNDGKKDLVIGDGRGAQTRVWRNIGSDAAPEFSTHNIQYLPPDAGIRPYHETVQPCIADWNGDGNKDLIMGRNRGVYVYLNEGTDAAPTFDFDRSRLGAKIRNVFPAERLSPVVVDWDGDGTQDLVVGSQRGEVWFARNVGSKTRPEFKDYTSVQVGGEDIHVGSEARIAVADLDGDGSKDLVVGGGSGLVWFFQARHPDPVARSRHARVKRGGSVPVELVGTDDAGRTLTYTVLTQPKHGTLTGTAPNLTYTPTADYQGNDRFTFNVAAGKVEAAPATVMIEVQPADSPPVITTQPVDVLVGVGQPAVFRVVASGTPRFTYEWKKNGTVIPGATRPEYAIRETKEADSATFSVTIKNAVGSVSSDSVALQVKPFPTAADDVPVIGIQYTSPVIEPSTSGVLTLTRTGNTARAVTVKLTSRRGHNPVIADLHYVPVPSSITLKAGQTSVQIRVTPINDTLVTGSESLTFQIVPNPAYRVASKAGAARMTFLDDDCPHVGISVVKDETTSGSGVRTFKVTAQPAPGRDTQIAYSVGGTAIQWVDYQALPGTVTIPAGKTSATIVVMPYRPVDSGQEKAAEQKAAKKKSVVLTLPYQPFTYFDFYRYLTQGRPRSASVMIAPSATSPQPPPAGESTSGGPADTTVEKLRGAVSRLGWIVFAARSGGSNSDLDLFVMRPDGSQLRNITNTPKFDEYSARVSPLGEKLLYRRTAKGTRIRVKVGLPQDVGTLAMRTRPAIGALVIASADGSAPGTVGDDGACAWASWGPDGKQIACLEKVEPKDPASEKPTGSGGQKTASFRIVIRDADTLSIVKAFPSAGIHSQAIWSPDGQRICGPADIPPGKSRFGKGIEYPLGVGKMASLDIASGQRTALGLFPDWTSVWSTDSDGDWFQGGSPWVLHSANNYGLCPAYYPMLWRSGLQGEPSQLVFAEFKKNIWGGCTSPDDKYAIFVISGETWPLQGKMAIVRLADTPIARGPSSLFHEVLADHFPDLKRGPVLDLPHVPEGFDPHWTMTDFGADSGPSD
jgi:hypothetical protein